MIVQVKFTRQGDKIIDVPIVDQPPETPDTIEYTYNALYIYKLERQELNDEPEP